jgi:hypothetical protein
MFKFSKDGSRESIVTIATAWPFAHEGKTRLTSGLRKKSLCVQNGTVIDQGREGISLPKKKRLNRYEQLKGMHEHEMKTTKTYS